MRKLKATKYSIIFLNKSESRVFCWGKGCDIITYQRFENWIKTLYKNQWEDYHNKDTSLVRLK